MCWNHHSTGTLPLAGEGLLGTSLVSLGPNFVIFKMRIMPASSTS